MSSLSLFWEDRVKGGENFVTNKAVKISEALGGRLPFGWSPFVKCYIEGDSIIELWFRLTSLKGNSCDFLAIMKFAACCEDHRPQDENLANQSSIWQSDSLRPFWTESCRFMESRADYRTSMFVIVPEAIENPERMRIWVVPSFVWLVGLETSDNIYSRLREAIERFQFDTKFSTRITDRKGNIRQSLRRTPRKNAKLPNQIVQNGTEVMDTIPDDETQMQWRLFPASHLDPQEVIDSITIFLGHHFMMNTIKELSGLTFEVLQVLPRPI